MSTPPKRFTAASTMASQLASELGRLATTSALPPSFSHSAATFFSASAPFAQTTTLAPAAASVLAEITPNAPVAPVMIAVLPLTLNSDSGSFRKSSDILLLAIEALLSPHHGRACPGHPRLGNRKGVDARTRPGMTAVYVAHARHHAGGAATATKIVHTLLVRLMISRLSFGPMKQESFFFNTVSFPLTMT